MATPILVLFGPALFSDRLFALRDAGHYYYPLFKWCADMWGAGSVPLWNPLENCGTAVHADPTASIWYPGKLVFALRLEFSVKFKLYIVGHVVLCAWAAYWLARKWEGGRYACALAALSYSCGGSVVFQHCNVVYLVGAAWLPVAAALVDEVLRERRFASAVWLGVVLALMVLGGDPQMAYHVLLLGGLYAVLLAFGKREQPGSQIGSSWVRLALLGGAAIAAFLLAAVQILPSAEATATSERAAFDAPRSIYEAAGQFSAGKFDGSQIRMGLVGQPKNGTHHATAYDFSIAPWRFAELAWPNCGGRMYPKHRRWFSLLADEPRIWSPALYLGLLPLVLGLGALDFRGSEVRTRWLSWTLVLFALGSLGSFGLGWVARKVWLACGGSGADFPLGNPVGGVYWLLVVLLPKYVYFRYPAKLLVVASLAIAMLAARGWDRALAGEPRRLTIALLVLGIGSGIAGLAALVASQFFVLGESQTSSAFGPFDSLGAWNDVVWSLVHAAVVALAAAGLIWQNNRRAPAPSHMSQAALLALCAAELTLANHWLVPTAPAQLWREPSVVARAIDGGNSPRAYRGTPWFPQSFLLESSATRLEEIVAWERQTLAGRYGLLDRVAIVNAQVGIKRADHEALLDGIADSTSGEAWRDALGRLGVDYAILSTESPPDFAERVPDDGLPEDTAIWRVTVPPHKERVEYRFDPAPFYRGAWISGVSWTVVALIGLTAFIRRLARSSTTGTPRARRG
ncbi:MAG: YfhO family protein [Planctomycetaceae bacterium]|nr:YfhO family protein [Planctomycetaceae bacterium]